MQVKLPRYLWWWIILSAAAVIGLVVGVARTVQDKIEDEIQDKRMAATVCGRIRPGMTYQQVSDVMGKAGWHLLSDYRGRNLHRTAVWQDQRGHNSIKVSWSWGQMHDYSIVSGIPPGGRGP